MVLTRVSPVSLIVAVNVTVPTATPWALWVLPETILIMPLLLEVQVMSRNTLPVFLQTIVGSSIV